MNIENDFLTQEISQPSQTQDASFAESQDQLPPRSSWSSLELTYGQQRLIRLREPTVIFGRSLSEEAAMSSTQLEHFDETDFKNNSDFICTSSKHFTIEKMLRDPVTGFEFNENTAPAIITCNGRNGFLVDNVFLNQNQKLVLKHNSKLRLPRSKCMFGTFKYDVTIGHGLPDCQLMEDYFIGEEIGAGGNGSVRTIIPFEKLDGQQHYELRAVKTIKYATVNSQMSSDFWDALAAVKNEATIMKKINHQHVMGLFSEYITDRHVHLVVELMCGGDLFKHIQNTKDKRLSEVDSKFFFTQVLSGIRYLHDKGITHRDIKIDNILLKDNCTSTLVKIADFGLSKIQNFMTTICGTFQYSAPEILQKIGYTNNVDIWSLGCLLYCMLIGQPPFEYEDNESIEDFSEKINRCEYPREPFEEFNISSSAVRILELTIQSVPKYRFNAKELQRLNWVKDVNNQQRIEEMNRKYGIKQENDSYSLPNQMEESLVLESGSTRRNRPDDDTDDSDDGKVEQLAKRSRVAK